jgi:molybdopterin/thiamine biosynthesis adenylyltransferase
MGKKKTLALGKIIENSARIVKDPAGREVKILKDDAVEKICSRHGAAFPEVYVGALKHGIIPYRYLRNREAVTPGMQLKLAESRVAVIGAGGLGGNVILLLARLGVGCIAVVDGDAFDETNQNRQALSNMKNMGINKAMEAASTLGSMNPGVEVVAHPVRLDSRNGKDILSGCRVVVDALDNVADRFVVERIAKDLGIPMVHGAVAGFEGQVMSIFPDDPGLELLYGKGGTTWQPEKRAEAVLGVPAVAPSLMATLQVMEVLKILLNRGRLLRNRMLRIDLETVEFHEIVFKE